MLGGLSLVLVRIRFLSNLYHFFLVGLLDPCVLQNVVFLHDVRMVGPRNAKLVVFELQKRQRVGLGRLVEDHEALQPERRPGSVVVFELCQHRPLHHHLFN